MITSEHKHTANASDSGLGRAFILAFILAQDTERAEHIVATAIDTLPCNDFSEARLLAAVAAVAWTLRKEGVTRRERVDLAAQISIPVELQRVLELPIKLRYCFSLRALAGMTVWTCAQLTSLHPQQIEYLFQLAARTLAAATKPRPGTDNYSPAAAMLFVDGNHSEGCGDVQ